MEFYSTRANEVKHRIIKLTVFVGNFFWNLERLGYAGFFLGFEITTLFHQNLPHVLCGNFESL